MQDEWRDKLGSIPLHILSNSVEIRAVIDGVPVRERTSLRTAGIAGTGKIHSINSRVAYICDRLLIKSDIKLLKIYSSCIERLNKLFINYLSNDQIPDSIVKGLMVRFIGFSMIDQQVGCGEIKI